MASSAKKASHKAGMAPGALVHVGERKAEKAKITVMDYSAKKLVERKATADEACRFAKNAEVTWVNVDGLHDTKLIEKIGKAYGLHPLIQEDILHTGQRPKLEDSGDSMFVAVKMLAFNEKKRKIDYEQVSIVFGKGFVLSFQEREGDIFDPVRKRIRNEKSRLRKLGADYLAYALLDAVVDNYFVVLEKTGERLEELEEELISEPSTETMQEIHKLKREMIMLRKSVWPLREVISAMERSETRLIDKKTFIYLRDLYDHTIQVIDTVETYRDMVSGMLDIYLSSISNRMNAVMKVLTIIATIFIPLTFIAGVYGMNFRYMPELGWEYGYFSVLGVMLAVGIVMVLFFRRKGWL